MTRVMTMRPYSGYVPMGDIATSDFNSSKYPGVCKPSTFAALAKFKELQAQLNRVSAVTGGAPIVVDGDIGPGTVGLYSKVKAQLVTYAAGKASGPVALSNVARMGAATDCISIATIADLLAVVAKGYADENKVPATVPGPAPAKLPTIVTASGQEQAVTPQMELFGKIFGRPLSSTEKLALLAVGGGVGYMLLTRKKRGKRR